MMEGADIWIMVLSMLGTFLVGLIASLFLGGRSSLNKLIVRASRGRKLLVFGKTAFGWKDFVGKKENNTLTWKYDGKPLITDISNDGSGIVVTRFNRLDACFVDADKPAKALRIKDDAMYPDDFDPATYNHILIRALTRPSADGTDDIKKLLQVVLALVIVGILIGVAVYFKVADFTSASGVVI